MQGDIAGCGASLVFGHEPLQRQEFVKALPVAFARSTCARLAAFRSPMSFCAANHTRLSLGDVLLGVPKPLRIVAHPRLELLRERQPDVLVAAVNLDGRHAVETVGMPVSTSLNLSQPRWMGFWMGDQQKRAQKARICSIYGGVDGTLRFRVNFHGHWRANAPFVW